MTKLAIITVLAVGALVAIIEMSRRATGPTAAPGASPALPVAPAVALDRAALREDLRAIVREELRAMEPRLAAPPPVAAAEPTAPASTEVHAVEIDPRAVERAAKLVADSAAARRITAEDAIALRGLMVSMSADDRMQIYRSLAKAINQGVIKVEPGVTSLL